MDNKIKYSIIVPIYNCATFLPRCIESITRQASNNVELILIDDGSKDESGKVCDEYAEKNKIIKVIHKKNEGQSKARNDGLEISKGKYILFIDADDYLNDGYFDEIEKILEINKDVELINFGFYSDVDDEKFNTLSSDVVNYKEIFYKNKNEIKKEYVSLWDNTMLYNIWNKVYIKKIIKENNIKFYKSDWGEDVEFNKNYLDVISNLYNSNKCFYHYVRERQGASTKKYKENFFEIRKKEFINFNNYFEKWEINKNDYYEFSCRRYIERVLGCIENVYCSNMNFSKRKQEIKKIITDSCTREALKYAIPKSKKIKIMLLPIKIKSTLLTMLMGKTFNILKNKYPSLFNKLKNRR